MDFINSFKIELNFRLYNFTYQYLNKSNTWDETYKVFGDKLDISYNNEENPIITFAFYPIKSSDNYNTVRNIINILKELFDDRFNIGVDFDQIPRFNFKINDSVYFAFGDSNKKQDSLIKNVRTKFYSPTDYRDLDCTKLSVDECIRHNSRSKKIHNHEICKLNEERNSCVSNNTYQHNLLLERDDLLIFFPMLQPQKLIEQDLIWQKFCKHLKWEYYSTI